MHVGPVCHLEPYRALIQALMHSWPMQLTFLELARNLNTSRPVPCVENARSARARALDPPLHRQLEDEPLLKPLQRTRATQRREVLQARQAHAVGQRVLQGHRHVLVRLQTMPESHLLLLLCSPVRDLSLLLLPEEGLQRVDVVDCSLVGRRLVLRGRSFAMAHPVWQHLRDYSQLPSEYCSYNTNPSQAAKDMTLYHQDADRDICLIKTGRPEKDTCCIRTQKETYVCYHLAQKMIRLRKC
jgi:hypothetical protein